MKPRWAQILVLAGAAGFMGSMLTLELYFNSRASMKESIDVVDLAIPQFGRAILWALLTPFVLAMQRKLPLHRGYWVGGIAFHLTASFVVMATYYLGRLWSYTIFFENPWKTSFWTMAHQGFFGHNLVDMACYWAILGFGFSIEVYRKFKSHELKSAQLEMRLMETELKSLRQQLHPHFLFNTLNTISVLVRERRHDEAITLIARLSTLLRTSLDNTGIPEVTVQQEMEFLNQYIEIQKMRFSDRLTVHVSISPAARLARIPNLLLQPIVENAILHGVAPKPGPGRVEILGEVEDEKLRLEVRDDGPGIANGHTRTKEGVGLANTRERLVKIYGARSQLLLQSQPGRGVSVLVTLPYRT